MTNTTAPLAPSTDTESSTLIEKKVEFADFDLPKPLLNALDGLGFKNPTLVQEKTLESALKGNDLMVSAQTGSGKTAAFLLPCLTHVLNNLPAAHNRHREARPQILVICPTRELVQQVTQDTIKLMKHCKGLRVANIMGGMSYPKQIAGLKGAQIVIATPGRLLDLEARNNIQLNDVSHMVLDEADRMLDLGFSEDLAKIAKLCERRQQSLLFSATFAKNIVGLAQKLMKNPERIELANSQDRHEDISQSLYWADDENHKQALLMHWLEHEPIDQIVIFAPTQVETERLGTALRKAGHNVVDLHGGMRQYMRMKQIKKVRDGKAKILVATDVAARGLDVPSISHVINYGIPMKNEDYVHRVGRTGRAGKQGRAITVTTHSDRRKVSALQHFLKQDIEVLEVKGLEPKPYQARSKKKNNSRRRGNPRPNQFERGNRSNRSGGEDKDKKFSKAAKPEGRQGRDERKGSYSKDGFKKDGFKKDVKKSYRGRNRNDGEQQGGSESTGNRHDRKKPSYKKSHERGSERSYSKKPHERKVSHEGRNNSESNGEDRPYKARKPKGNGNKDFYHSKKQD